MSQDDLATFGDHNGLFQPIDYEQSKGDRRMTIGIAAVCKYGDSEAVVLAADRMRTMTAPLNLQTQPPLKKILPLTNSGAILFAGPSDAESLAVDLSEELNRASHKPRPLVDKVVVAYKALKQRRVEEAFVTPLGTDLAGLRDLLARSPASQILSDIVVRGIGSHNLGIDLLVAATDGTKAELYYVGNPGMFNKVGQSGFWAIGTGFQHAVITLAARLQRDDLSLNETLCNVYDAKKVAEGAPGVGEDTDFAVLHKQRLIFLGADVIQHVADARNPLPRLNTDQNTQLTASLQAAGL